MPRRIMQTGKMPGIGQKTERKLKRLGITDLGPTIYYPVQHAKKPFWRVW